MIPKAIPKTTTLDFKENYSSIMGIFSSLYTVIETCAPSLDEDTAEISAAIGATISYLFGGSVSDPNSISKLTDKTYNDHVLFPSNSQYKVFYDYIRLILKSSKEHNKRLKQCI